MDQQTSQIINELHKLTEVPVDLDILLKEERSIVCMPGNYGNGFEGRIEYIPSDKFFIIYHPVQMTNRVRFSIAHELAHYHIPSHRSLIINGKSHSSISGYISDKRLEREADEFAAHLLIPQDHIDGLIRRIGYIPLDMLVSEANLINVSVMAMAIRYIKTTPDKCALILSEDGKQKFYWPSEEMDATGFGGRGRKDFPQNSVTLQALKNTQDYNENGMAYCSSDWFSQRRSEFNLWEEACPLGYGNFVLTMLADRDHETRY